MSKNEINTAQTESPQWSWRQSHWYGQGGLLLFFCGSTWPLVFRETITSTLYAWLLYCWYWQYNNLVSNIPSAMPLRCYFLFLFLLLMVNQKMLVPWHSYNFILVIHAKLICNTKHCCYYYTQGWQPERPTLEFRLDGTKINGENNT